MDIKEKVNLKYKFKEHLMHNVLPILDGLETFRQKELSKYNFTNFLYVGVLLLALISLIFLFNSLGTGTRGLLLVIIFFFPAAGLIGVMVLWAFIGIGFYRRRIRTNFKKYIKDACMPKTLSFFENLVYKDQEIPEGLYKESGLFSSFDIVKRDDVFSGKYKEVWYHIEEIILYKTPGILTGRYGAESFRGIVIVIPAEKFVNNQTIISSKYDSNIQNKQPHIIPTFIMLLATLCIYLLSIIFSEGIMIKSLVFAIVTGIAVLYLFFDTIQKSKKYEGVKLEDIGFDKRFAVYSKDQIEARYIVSPAFMDRLKDLQTAFGANDIKCSFWKNRVMVAISTDKDWFEVGNLKNVLPDLSQLDKFFDEMTSVYDVIDYFKLAEKTGM